MSEPHLNVTQCQEYWRDWVKRKWASGRCGTSLEARDRIIEAGDHLLFTDPNKWADLPTHRLYEEALQHATSNSHG